MCEDRSAEALRHGRRAEALRHGRPAKALRHRRLRLWRMPSGLRIVPLKAAPYILLAFLSCGCATNPATGQRQFSLMSEDQELAIGREQVGLPAPQLQDLLPGKVTARGEMTEYGTDHFEISLWKPLSEHYLQVTP